MANTNLFKIFIEVAERGNITKAAEKLYISQPAITKSIKQLEGELGGKLFVRKNKGVELTIEGEYIYNKVKPLIEDLDSVYDYFNNVKKLKTGVLRIGTTTSNITILLSRALNAFTVKYPNIEIKIKREKETSLINQLRNNEIDLAVLDSSLKKPDLIEVKSFSVNYNVVGNKKYFKKYEKKPMTKEDFASCPLALINQGKTSRNNVETYFSNFGINLEAKYEMENYGLIIDLIKKGVAIGVVNLDYFQTELDKEEIFKINTTFEIDKRVISVVKSNSRYENSAKNIFIELLK